MTGLAFTVIVPAYNAGERIRPTVAALLDQRLDEPFEVVVVDSGPIPASLGAEAPNLRTVRSERRLLPGEARNAGVDAAAGEHIAFCSDDCVPVPGWLSARLAAHRAGHALVGGAVTNGTPHSRVGTAGYLLEYTALLPVAALLAEQQIPHSLSFHRSVFERVGRFPESTATGEDTVFGRRCLDAGLSVGFAAEATFAHANPTRVGPMLRHAYAHGRGLAECAVREGLPEQLAPSRPPAAVALQLMVLNPARGMLDRARRLARHAPGLLPTFAGVAPLVLAGQLAIGAGALGRWLKLRRAPG